MLLADPHRKRRPAIKNQLRPAPLPAAGAGFGPAQPNVLGPQPRFARRYETSQRTRDVRSGEVRVLRAGRQKNRVPGSPMREPLRATANFTYKGKINEDLIRL